MQERLNPVQAADGIREGMNSGWPRKERKLNKQDPGIEYTTEFCSVCGSTEEIKLNPKDLSLRCSEHLEIEDEN